MMPLTMLLLTDYFLLRKTLRWSFEMMLAQKDHGTLQVELQDRENNPASRIIWDEDGYLKYKDGYRVKNIGTYNKDELYKIRWEADVKNRFLPTVHQRQTRQEFPVFLIRSNRYIASNLERGKCAVFPMRTLQPIRILM